MGSEELLGETFFFQMSCNKCHIPDMQSSVGPVNAYTDLLLHDMGPELDDGYTEGRALTSEWRTPPLWGIGIQENFQGGQAFYLHDGRAQTFEQTIGLHGGEGAASRSAFQALSDADKTRLVRFLRSL